MGLKKYIVASLIFIALVGGYVFSLVQQEFQITLFESTLSLPIALWIVLPLLILFVASLLHMMFYGVKGYVNKVTLHKDENNLYKLLKAKLLKKDETYKFNNPIFKDLAEILDGVEFEVKDKLFNSNNNELNQTAREIFDIKSGKLVNLSTKLDANNAFAVLNTINKINEQSDFALDVLKKADNYTQKEVEAAFQKVLEEKSMTSLKKVLPTLKLNKNMLFELLKKDSVQKEFNLSKEELLKYIKAIELDAKEFIDIAQMYKNSLSPDEVIDVFEALSNSNENALNAYVYILIEFEMIEKVRDIFLSSSSEEFIAYKALLDLRDAGKHYTIDSICYNK
jgi:hypothetical protein